MNRLVLAAIGALLPGRVKTAYLRAVLGATIEEGASIGFGTVIWAERITLGRHATIGRFCRIRAREFRADSHVVIEDFVRITVHRCHLHSRAIISSHATIAGDSVDRRSVLQMGMHSWVFQDCYVDVARAVTMGRNVGVGGGTYIFTHGYWLSKLQGYPAAYGPVELGDDVWIPWGCFILPGVKIGRGVVMGARAVVNKDVPDGALIGGVPAKILRERSNRDVTDDEKLAMLEEVTADFATYTSREFSRHEAPAWIDLHVDGAPLLRLHRPGETAAESLSAAVLNILFQPPSSQRDSVQWLSLADFRSSSYGSFSLNTRRWLQHARTIGLRFYPIDELAQYAETD